MLRGNIAITGVLMRMLIMVIILRNGDETRQMCCRFGPLNEYNSVPAAQISIGSIRKIASIQGPMTS